jgi:hypothetical protein
MCDKSEYTFEFRILAATWWHESDKSKPAMKNIRQLLSERFHLPGDVPHGRVIKLWEKKLFATGSLVDKPRSGRPSAFGDVADECHPQQSVRDLAEAAGVSKSTMHRHLCKGGYKPFKPTFTQFLSADDEDSRLHACGQLLDKYPSDFSQRNIFFSDECAIYAQGKMENLVWWSKENPHFHKQLQLHPPTVMVWAAMSSKDLIGPFFVTGSITAKSYMELLEREFIPALQQRRLLNKAVFQQDGAPAHTAIATRQLLSKYFPLRWIGKFGPTPWPPRSPDLTSCDNALWGIIKANVKGKEVTSVDQLRAAITQAFEEIDAELLRKIHARTWRRIALCVALNGKQVDPFDK